MKQEPRQFIIPEIGPVSFRRSARAKRIGIRIDISGNISVSVPPGVSFEQARQFMVSRLPWAKRNIAHIVELRSSIGSESLSAVDRHEAAKTLAARIELLAGQHGFGYGRLSIRNQRTLWGSCSKNNNINLNQNLIRLPQELQDYVILHELVHTRVKNHSAAFWKELCRICPPARTRRRELRRYKLGLW
ncbi:MAG TPA: YgjP-like metallopeptidase domain-containing protein [Sedimentisphaerales bacterium]|nr:YgjP-like metallopeptidase domain-containing protein [Sedimentisphaerales bacterium]